MKNLITTLTLGLTLMATGNLHNVSAQKQAVYHGDDFSLRFDGRLTLEGDYYDTYQDLAPLRYDKDLFRLSNGFGFGQMRLGIVGNYGERWTGKVEVNLSNQTVRPMDIFIQYAFNKHTRLMLGHYRDAFSMEGLKSSRFQTMNSAMVVDFMTRGERYMGATFTHWANKYYLSMGLYFSPLSPTYQANRGTDGIGFSTRNLFTPINTDETTILLGFSGRVRTMEGQEGETHTLSLSTLPETSMIGHRFISSTIGAVDYYWLGGLEAALKYKKLFFVGEYMANSIHTQLRPTDNVNYSGWYVTGSYMLRGKQRAYLSADAMFSPLANVSSGGNLELITRLGQMNANDHSRASKGEFDGGKATSWMIGLNYYPNSNLILGLGYYYTGLDEKATAGGTIYQVGGGPFVLDLHAVQLRAQLLL